MSREDGDGGGGGGAHAGGEQSPGARMAEVAVTSVVSVGAPRARPGPTPRSGCPPPVDGAPSSLRPAGKTGG